MDPADLLAALILKAETNIGLRAEAPGQPLA
jgi:hypothetical protein